MNLDWHTAVGSAMGGNQGRALLSSVEADELFPGILTEQAQALSSPGALRGKYCSYHTPGFLIQGTDSTHRVPWLCLIKED